MTNFVFDLETNALELEDVDRITMFVYAFKKNGEWQTRSTTNYDEMRKFFNHKSIKAGHNILRYDLPVAKKILGIEYDYRDYVDTLGASWTLYPKRIEHGIGSWGKEFGVEKPHIENFENVSEEEIRHRCTEDVVINCKLVDKIEVDLNSLYGNTHWHVYLRYLGFKLHTETLHNQWQLSIDFDRVEKFKGILQPMFDAKKKDIEQYMNPVPIYAKKKKPTTLYKKDGSLSVAGEGWKKLTEENNLPLEYEGEIKTVVNYKEPNAGSPVQLKVWLDSLGWKPLIYKKSISKVTGKENKAAQIYIDGDDNEKVLCHSVLEIDHPAIESLNDLGVIKHRLGLLKSFEEESVKGKAPFHLGGLTNTLRMKHSKPLANLPKPKKKFGEMIRGCLTCEEGYLICDSDLESLENMIKYDLIHDMNPEKVAKALKKGYDSHIETAVASGLMSAEDAKWYLAQKNEEYKQDEEKFKSLGVIRDKAKSTSYSAQYGVGAKTLSIRLKVKQSVAKALLDGYWRENAELKAVEKTFQIKESLGIMWVKNPYNKFWYELRHIKDILSTIIQSAGDFICFLWTKKSVEKIKEGLALVYHDQQNYIITEDRREFVAEKLQEAINDVNKALKLKVPMRISISFGSHFDKVH